MLAFILYLTIPDLSKKDIKEKVKFSNKKVTLCDLNKECYE